MAELSQGNTPLIKIDSATWQLIEKAFGASLLPNLRADAVRATEAFLFSEKFERKSESIAKAKIILEAHDKAATRFFNELFGGPASLTDAATYAHYLIDNNFKRTRTGHEKTNLDEFLDFLRAFHIACNTAIKQLNDLSTEKSWKIWLHRLDEIVAKNSPPKQCGGDAEADHPFVQFILALQEFLPPHCQRDRTAIRRAHQSR
jgi:hypothetical protein